MPVSLKIVDNGLGIVLTAQDYLLIKEVYVASLNFFTQHTHELSSCRYGLADYSQVTDTDADHAKIRRLASAHIDASKINIKLILAICSPADHIFGIARMWGILAEATGWEIRIFRSTEDAKAWIRSYIEEPLTFQ